MENSCNKDFYKTKDLAEAAFLYASHKIFSKLEKKDYFYWFCFEDNAGCTELINLFWRREARVNAKDYADAFRSLKDRLFSEDRR